MFVCNYLNLLTSVFPSAISCWIILTVAIFHSLTLNTDDGNIWGHAKMLTERRLYVGIYGNQRLCVTISARLCWWELGLNIHINGDYDKAQAYCSLPLTGIRKLCKLQLTIRRQCRGTSHQWYTKRSHTPSLGPWMAKTNVINVVTSVWKIQYPLAHLLGSVVWISA